jgi:hypothetical protein
MGWYEDSKSVLEFIQKSDNIDLVKKMLDIQKQSMDLLEENRKLKENVKELEGKLKFKGKLIHRNNAYWFEEAGRQVPICTGCWDANSHQIRLKDFENGFAECPICKNTFEIAPSKGY